MLGRGSDIGLQACLRIREVRPSELKVLDMCYELHGYDYGHDPRAAGLVEKSVS